MIRLLAAVYRWPPSEIDALEMDDLIWWAEAAAEEAERQDGA